MNTEEKLKQVIEALLGAKIGSMNGKPTLHLLPENVEKLRRALPEFKTK